MKFVTRFEFTVGAILSLVLLASAHAQTSELSRDERWREDVRFYSAELSKRHKNLFFQLSKDEFEREVKNLEARIPKLSDGRIALELMCITARVGDGHTSSWMSPSGMAFFPLRLERFKEGWFVAQTTDEYKQALGARLIRIGDVKIEEVARRMKELIAADNELDRRSRLRYFFIWSGVLQAEGILPQGETGRFTFLDRDGKQFALDVRPVSPEQFLKSQLRDLSDVGRAPLSAKNAQSNYWFEYLPRARTLYLAYNQCANDANKPFTDFVKELFAVVDAQPTERFVVDLRRNGGGNSSVIKSLYDELKKRPRLIGKGKLLVLVSNTTFSSAFMNMLEMRDRMNAVLIGEPSGQKPNAYGEVRRFQLPHSKIEIQYSTKFWELMKNSDSPYLPVDIHVEPTFADYAQGRDAVLQAALDYKAK